FERSNLVLFLGTRTYQYDGDVPRALVIAQATGEGNPGNARRNPVNQDQVRANLAHERFGLGNVARAVDLVTRAFEIGSKQLAGRHFLFHQQNGAVHGFSSYW